MGKKLAPFFKEAQPFELGLTLWLEMSNKHPGTNTTSSVLLSEYMVYSTCISMNIL